MATFKITIDKKGLQPQAIKRLLIDLKLRFKDATITSEKVEQAESRADRFHAAMNAVADARSDVEELRDELQEWHDNLPQNFQDGDKGQEIQTAIDDLESVISEMESVEGSSVDFPGMY